VRRPELREIKLSTRALDVELPCGSGLRRVDVGPGGLLGWVLGEGWNCGKEGGDGVGESLLRALRRSIALLEVGGSSGFRVSLSLKADVDEMDATGIAQTC
jgi:hypothetical protein